MCVPLSEAAVGGLVPVHPLKRLTLYGRRSKWNPAFVFSSFSSPLFYCIITSQPMLATSWKVSDDGKVYLDIIPEGRS
jgi:hypothetical protein